MSAVRSISSRLREWVPAREIYLRTGGQVRFFGISSQFQLAVLGVIAAVLFVWLAGTMTMLWNQAGVAVERSELAEDRTLVARQQAEVNAYRKSVDEVAREIETRQDALDKIVRAHLGPLPNGGSAATGEAVVAPAASRTKISAAVPGAKRLEIMQLRQSAFEARLYVAAQRRILHIEKAIRGLGVNPAVISGGQAMGGPFIPAKAASGQLPGLQQLTSVLSRLQALEAGLAGIPSGRPAQAPMETSSYGYRRDPFNGLPAFHSGMDFPGTHGQPILAAADGKVSFVGTRSGYGNVVEIEHGNGFMTRYAHLSGFTARPGTRVARGQSIGKMGSTGRSTGTHLHFEVRVNGAAINPRPFLEARQDVLEIQRLAQQRRAIGGNGR